MFRECQLPGDTPKYVCQKCWFATMKELQWKPPDELHSLAIQMLYQKAEKEYRVKYPESLTIKVPAPKVVPPAPVKTGVRSFVKATFPEMFSSSEGDDNNDSDEHEDHHDDHEDHHDDHEDHHDGGEGDGRDEGNDGKDNDPLASLPPIVEIPPPSTADGITSSPAGGIGSSPAGGIASSPAAGSTQELNFPVVMKDGYLVVPRSKDYSVNELEMISRLKTDEIHKHLWSLLCVKARGSCDQLRPGATEDTVDRCLLYFRAAEDALRTYPTTEAGEYVLSKITGGLRDVQGKAMWPITFYTQEDREGTFWYDKKTAMLSTVQTWIGQSQCKLLEEEKRAAKNASSAYLVHYSQIRLGQQIMNTCLAVSKETNNHANKQWPKTFASGESKSAHLQVIRRWYWNTVEAVAKATNNFRSFSKKAGPDGQLWTKEMEIQKYRDKFQLNWFPGKATLIASNHK